MTSYSEAEQGTAEQQQRHMNNYLNDNKYMNDNDRMNMNMNETMDMNMNETMNMNENEIAQLEEAIRLISPPDKEAYLQACRIAPHVVATESNPLWFLRYESCDFWAAARCLVTYWTERKKIFGDVRAFLPLSDLSGKGALSADALMLLRSGILVVLPNDQQGRSVVYWDREQCEGHTPSLLNPGKGKIPFLMHVFFYTIHVILIAQQQKSKTQGFVFLARVRKRAQGKKFNDKNHNFHDLTRVATTAFPLKPYGLHICACVPSSSSFTKTIILAMLQRVAGILVREAKFHFEASTERICQKLQAWDFTPQGIPVKLGGSWTYDEFIQSFEGQVQGQVNVVDVTAAKATPPYHPLNLNVLGAAAEIAFDTVQKKSSPQVHQEQQQAQEKTSLGGLQVQTDQARHTKKNKNKNAHLKSAPQVPQDAGPVPSPLYEAAEPRHMNNETFSMDQLEQGLHMISAQDKADYLQACRIVPHLVETESNPLWFLRREDYNFWAAARRLVTYWTERKKIFGERAFLSVMDLSGNGALDQKAVDLLSTGISVVLPNDRQGRSVIYFNRERFLGQAPLLLQVGFYNLSVVAQSEKSQTGEFVLLARIRQGAPGKVACRGHFVRFAELVSKAFPVRLHSFHIAACVQSSSCFIQTSVMTILQRLGSYFLASARFHIDDSEEKVLQKLRACDFIPEGVPDKLGGSWTYDKFTLPTMAAAAKDGCAVHVDLRAPATDHAHAAALSQPLNVIGAAAEMEVDSFEKNSSRDRQYDENMMGGLQQEKRQTSVCDSVDSFRYEDTAVMQQEGRLKLDEALKTIHKSEKTAYLEAVKRVPDLVENESNSIHFLRCDRYDPWAAARRLTTYWKRRLEIFGDRAFLPLNQTGQGALGPEDLEVLNSGYLVVLPNDREGRSVMSVDCSKLPPFVLNNEMARLRCFFYVISVIAENETTQRGGYVGIAVMEPTASYDRDFPFIRACGRLVQDALPVRIHQIHLVCLSSKVGSGSLYTSLVAATINMMGHLLTSWATIQHADSGQELVKKLKECGLTRRGIPLCIGGIWDMENFHNWQKRRTRHEEDLILNEKEKLERKRKVNAVHSRQKRERRKIEKEVLQEQCDGLRASNAALFEQGKQLEELLETAKSEVALMERLEATKVNTAALVEQIRNGPSGTTLQPHLAGLPHSGDSIFSQGAYGLRASLDSQDFSHRLVAERNLPGDEFLQIELRNRVLDGVLLSNALPSRIPHTANLVGHRMDLGLSTPFYEQTAASMFGQQQHTLSYSTSPSGDYVWQQPVAPASPQPQQNLTNWGSFSLPWFPFQNKLEDGDRRRF